MRRGWLSNVEPVAAARPGSEREIASRELALQPLDELQHVTGEYVLHLHLRSGVATSAIDDLAVLAERPGIQIDRQEIAAGIRCKGQPATLRCAGLDGTGRVAHLGWRPGLPFVSHFPQREKAQSIKDPARAGGSLAIVPAV